MAVVKRSEVKSATSRVVLASMESVMAKGDSEAHGDWCWDIVVNTVRCKTRKVGRGCRWELRSRSGRRKSSSAKLRTRAGFRNVVLCNAAEQREKQRTSAKQVNVNTKERHSMWFELYSVGTVEQVREATMPKCGGDCDVCLVALPVSGVVS